MARWAMGQWQRDFVSLESATSVRNGAGFMPCQGLCYPPTGVEQLVILGNSGGGSLMGAYLSQAQGVTMTPTPGLRLPDAMHQLPGADLITDWLKFHHA